MGIYVGFATVGVFAAWYMFGSVLGVRLDGDGHTPITWQQLTSWESCPEWKDFHVGTPAPPVLLQSCCVSHLSSLRSTHLREHQLKHNARDASTRNGTAPVCIWVPVRVFSDFSDLMLWSCC